MGEGIYCAAYLALLFNELTQQGQSGGVYINITSSPFYSRETAFRALI